MCNQNCFIFVSNLFAGFISSEYKNMFMYILSSGFSSTYKLIRQIDCVVKRVNFLTK